MDYFMNESISDVVFVIDGQRLPANKLYLTFKSKVFRAMFSDNFKESKDKEVVIEDTTFEAFKTMIQFLYSDELVFKDGNDFKLIDEVYHLSDRYEAFKLFDKLAKHMKTIPFSFENIELISRIAVRSENNGLIKKVLTFIDNNFNHFVNKDDKELIEWNDSTHNQLLKVLANNYRTVKKQLTDISSKINSLRIKRCNQCTRIQILTHYNPSPPTRGGRGTGYGRYVPPLNNECPSCKISMTSIDLLQYSFPFH